MRRRCGSDNGVEALLIVDDELPLIREAAEQVDDLRVSRCFVQHDDIWLCINDAAGCFGPARVSAIRPAPLNVPLEQADGRGA
jgi:hypothetical protein